MPRHGAVMLRVAVAWWLVTFFMLFSPHPAIWYGGSAVALVLLCPKDLPDRLLFYCALLPAAPLYLGWAVPFPGTNYLLRLFYPTFLNLVLLLPIVLAKDTSPPQTRGKEQSMALFFGMAYIVLISLLDFRSTTVTNGMRIAFDHFMSMGLIVLVLMRARKFPETPERILLGLFLGGAVLVFIGIMQGIQGWLIYSQASDLVVSTLDYQDWMEFRGGRLRLPATMNAIPFGIYMGLCLAITLHYLSRREVNFWAWLFVFVFAYALWGSGSRGALLMVALIGVSYFGFFSRQTVLRYLAYSGAVIFVFVLTTTDLGNLIVETEEHGTLAYRIDLIANSLDSISRHPFFGTPDFLENQALQASYQGQGIIDVVNAYLQVTLRYGLVGLLLYFLALRYGLKHIRNFGRSLVPIDGQTFDGGSSRFVASMTVGYALMIVSVSLVDRLAQYYWILVFLCCSYPVVVAKPKPKVGFAR